jgi:STE24 endopeptidase
MSEKTAIRMGQVVTLAVAAVGWGVGAWLLARTSVPSLDLSGVDEHRFFTEHAISSSAHYAHGVQALWLGRTVVVIAALVVLARRLPSSVRGMELGRIGSAIVVGMVVLVTLWAASLPFGIVELWWQHHWGLAPFDVLAWLDSQWATLGAEAVSAMLTIVLLVGLAGRFRRWWLLAGATVVAIAAAFAFFSGWLLSADAHPLRSPELRADVQRIERVEHVTGAAVRVEDVSSWTTQANAFTAGFGPS